MVISLADPLNVAQWLLTLDFRSTAMKPEQIYQDLKDLAEKLDVTVAEQSFRSSGIPVKSGVCLIKGSMHCIIDRNISLNKKIKVLAKALVDLPHENVFVVPEVRDVINKYSHRPKRVPDQFQTDL
jgi:hypothetical protein